VYEFNVVLTWDTSGIGYFEYQGPLPEGDPRNRTCGWTCGSGAPPANCGKAGVEPS
jgi:hypothetical protein